MLMVSSHEIWKEGIRANNFKNQLEYKNTIDNKEVIGNLKKAMQGARILSMWELTVLYKEYRSHRGKDGREKHCSGTGRNECGDIKNVDSLWWIFITINIGNCETSSQSWIKARKNCLIEAILVLNENLITNRRTK